MADEGSISKDDLPVVLVHRAPQFNVPLTDRLLPHFRLLDPTVDSPDEPLTSFLSNHAQSVRALLCVGPVYVTQELLGLLPSLELVVVSGAGVERIDLQACRLRGVTVTNASQAFAEDAADYAVGLLLDVLRAISGGDRFVRGGSWPATGDYSLGLKLGGKRVGIVGLGHIGSEVAKRLLTFGCHIAYNSRRKKPSVPFPYFSSVRDLATESDALILCCSLTEETRHIINKDVLAALGKGGVIINVGRGSLINEKELVQSLVRGEIGGAGLDVFENEPEVPKDLLVLDNVVLSPHHAVVTAEALEAVKEISFANLKAFFSNEPLRSIVHVE